MDRNRSIATGYAFGCMMELLWEKASKWSKEGYAVINCEHGEFEEVATEEVQNCTSDEEAKKVFLNWIQKAQEEEGEPAPDWEAQSRYDELHGTINGRDPGVLLMEELWND